MNQRERAAIRWRIMGLGGASLALPLAVALWARLSGPGPESSWSIVTIPFVFMIVICVPALYFVSSLAIRVEEKRQLRTHCTNCGRELSRPGAYRCGECRRPTVDGYRAIVGWFLAAGVVALFWLSSGWIVN